MLRDLSFVVCAQGMRLGGEVVKNVALETCKGSHRDSFEAGGSSTSVETVASDCTSSVAPGINHGGQKISSSVPRVLSKSRSWLDDRG